MTILDDATDAVLEAHYGEAGRSEEARRLVMADVAVALPVIRAAVLAEISDALAQSIGETDFSALITKLLDE